MQTQKMDFDKSYGQVYGHPTASYEQNGILYDAVGEQLKSSNAQPVVPTNDQNVPQEDSPEVKFLKNLLGGGPVLQKKVKQLSEDEDLSWSSVLLAATFLNIDKQKQGLANLWILRPGA